MLSDKYKRLFEHDDHTYTISTNHLTDTPLTYAFHVDRVGGDAQTAERVAERTYAFPDADHGHAFTESDVLVHALLNYLERTIKLEQLPPPELPNGWMRLGLGLRGR